MQTTTLRSIIWDYDPKATLALASTIPASWYLDGELATLEQRAVFGRSWQAVGRADQVATPGGCFTAVVAGEPIVVVRGTDGLLRAFFNVCRHHAAAVMTKASGECSVLRCPYHGWTYALDGSLKGAPEFDGVEDFEKKDNGLVPLSVDTWEQFVFVRLSNEGEPLSGFLGGLGPRVAPLDLSRLRFFERREYTLACNWKVYVDNYLDGGYHVPHLHKSLNTVLDYAEYRIETADRFCLQYSPMKQGADAATAAVRAGEAAYYYWLYPNFMLNWYEGVMDTNLVVPVGVDRCRVIFDFYFADGAEADHARRSIAVSDRVQQEDVDICESVQRGLASRAYHAGRLSVRREAGEHLFHRLLASDLRRGLDEGADPL